MIKTGNEYFHSNHLMRLLAYRSISQSIKSHIYIEPLKALILVRAFLHVAAPCTLKDETLSQQLSRRRYTVTFRVNG